MDGSDVVSSPGRGTAFCHDLPRELNPSSSAGTVAAAAQLQEGTPTITV